MQPNEVTYMRLNFIPIIKMTIVLCVVLKVLNDLVFNLIFKAQNRKETVFNQSTALNQSTLVDNDIDYSGNNKITTKTEMVLQVEVTDMFPFSSFLIVFSTIFAFG